MTAFCIRILQRNSIVAVIEVLCVNRPLSSLMCLCDRLESGVGTQT